MFSYPQNLNRLDEVKNGQSAPMRRIFEKSRCKCPRCVAKRRVQFLAVFGSCITAAAGCYLLVHHSDSGAPPALNQQEALAEEPTPDVNAIVERKAQPLSIAATQLRAVWKEQDNKSAQDSPPKESVSADSREQRESLTLPEGNRNFSENRSSNLVREVQPISHASGWQTVVPSEAPKNLPTGEFQREPKPDGEKVPATAALSSPEPPTDSKSNASQSGKPEEGTDHSLEVAESELPGKQPEPFAAERSGVVPPSSVAQSVADPGFVGPAVAAIVKLSPTPSNADTTAIGAADPWEKKDPEDVAMAKRSGADKPFEPQPKGPDSAIGPEPVNSEGPIHPSREPGMNENSAEAGPSNPYGFLSQWFPESRRTIQGKSVETSLDGNELLVQNQESATKDPVSGAPAIATTPGTDSKSNAKLDKPEEGTTRAPEVAESEMPGKQPPSGETSDVATPRSPAQSIADPSFAGPAVVATTNVSPALSNGHVVGVGAADPREKKNPEDVAMAKTSGPLTALVASLGNNISGEVPAREPRKPRGYITIKSEPEEAQNQEAEDHPPKPRDHPLKTQNHPANVEDYPPKALGHSQKPQDQPSNVRDYFSNTQDRPSKPPDTSGDLRRFASSFLQSDQTGNIADQHRFFADSVHYYHEGDLSWAGVAAATRRYHQGRQNRRYGAEGTATVKGPVNGGFYVVEQPVSWSRSEGSRVTRGRSLLRLRVVPTDRNGWKITSIEEIGQQ